MARKLSIETGEHLGRWRVNENLVHGLVRLEANRFPRFELYPDTSASFGPTDTPFEELAGHLHSNYELHTGPGQLTEFFPGQMFGGANWAVVGLGVNAVSNRRWDSAKAQVSGLETVIPHPIKSTEFPSTTAEPLHYAAKVSFSVTTSSAEGVEVVCSYDNTPKVADRYQFGVDTFAVIELKTDSPLTVEEWLTRWLDPIREVVSIANGRAERIASVVLQAETTDDHPTTGQLFGPGISQEVLRAEQQVDAHGLPLIPIFTLGEAPPLADLAARWRDFAAAHTAGKLYWLASDPDLSASVRFLLLVQALESMHARDNEASEQKAEQKHKLDRTAAIDELKSVKGVTSKTLKFVRKFLATKPYPNLASRLRSLLDEVPDSAVRIAAWTDATEALDSALRSSGKKPKDFADRLQDARNVLSHGHAELPSQPLSKCVNILNGMTRCRLLTYLGFTDAQVTRAYERAFSADA